MFPMFTNHLNQECYLQFGSMQKDFSSKNTSKIIMSPFFSGFCFIFAVSFSSSCVELIYNAYCLYIICSIFQIFNGILLGF